MSKINTASKNVKTKLSFHDYTQPTTDHAVKNLEIDQHANILVGQRDSILVSQEAGKPVCFLAFKTKTRSKNQSNILFNGPRAPSTDGYLHKASAKQ